MTAQTYVAPTRSYACVNCGVEAEMIFDCPAPAGWVRRPGGWWCWECDYEDEHAGVGFPPWRQT